MDHSRKIAFDGIINARDLGGLKTADGGTIRRGCLIRSANLFQATDADTRKLREEYRLRKVIDLRTTMSVEQKPDAAMEGVEYCSMPIFNDRMIGITHSNDRDYARRKTMMPDMKELYRMMVTREECVAQFGAVVLTIMGHDFDSGSVLWHCSEGKDRCGLTTAFLLSALGVSREQIMEDYLLTNETALARAEEYYRLVLGNGGTEEVASSVRDAFLVREEYLESALGAIEEKYMGMAGFLKNGLRIPEDVQAAFRSRVVG